MSVSLDVFGELFWTKDSTSEQRHVRQSKQLITITFIVMLVNPSLLHNVANLEIR